MRSVRTATGRAMATALWILSRHVVMGVIVTGVLAAQSGFHGFPPPTFTSDWLALSSTDQPTSYRVVPHGLGKVPILVKVMVKVIDGTNQDFVFEATGSAQTDNDIVKPRGGVLYAYTKDNVHIWSATDNTYSYTVFVASPWGGGKHAQNAQQALAQVQAWSPDDFYPPDYVSEEISMEAQQYREIQHNFAEIPVLLKVVGSFNATDTNSFNETYFFDGTGNLQVTFRDEHEHSGGVLYAYSTTTTRLWTLNTDAFVSEDGWGFNRKIFHIPVVKVKVLAWFSFPCLAPMFDSGWFSADQNTKSFYEMAYPQCNSARHVDVEVRAVDGANNGYIFEGTGTFQSAGRGNHDEIGGVVFAYNNNTIRLWIPSLATSGGVIVVTLQDQTQNSPTGELRVRVWCGNTLGIPVCPDSRTVTGCSKINPLVSGSQINSSLILLSSNPARSFLACVRRCLEIHYCRVLAATEVTCHLYADKHFGNATEVGEHGDFYRLVD